MKAYTTSAVRRKLSELGVEKPSKLSVACVARPVAYFADGTVLWRMKYQRAMLERAIEEAKSRNPEGHLSEMAFTDALERK